MPPNAEPQQHFAGAHSAPVDFTKRADLCELMDEPCDFAVLRSCLQSLETCNRLFRAYQPTLAFLDRVAARASGATIHIVDVGSGYGDMLRRVRRWSRMLEGPRARRTTPPVFLWARSAGSREMRCTP